MSRIKGIEVKEHKDVLNSRKIGFENERRKKEDSSSDELDRHEIMELVTKLPKLKEIFDVHRKIGTGTFSSVYLGSLKKHRHLPDNERQWFAIKHLVPNTHPARVEHELRCLQEMGGKDNIIGVELCLRHFDNIVFVMPYIPHKKFSEYVCSMEWREVREYMRALLTALRRVHSHHVIHRDVKPSNFLYDRERGRYLLVDFGLAQRIEPPPPSPPPPPPPSLHARYGKRTRDSEDESPHEAKRLALDLTIKHKYNKGEEVTKQQTWEQANSIKVSANASPQVTIKGAVGALEAAGARCSCWGVGGVCGACAGRAGARACRAGTGGFRPPEVLLKCPQQGTAVDMWAAGVVLASALCARYPFFRAADDASALAELADLLGTAALQRTAHTLGRRLLMSRTRRGLCLRKLCAHLRASPPRPAAPAPAPAGACKHCGMPAPQCLCPDPDTPADSYRAGARVAGFPDSVFALAARLLDPDPRTRITADQALAHPFFTAHT